MKRILMLTLCAALLIAACGSHVSAALLYDDFDVDTSANYTIIRSPVSPADSTAVFAFDYSTAGIPAAPGSSTTKGLRLAANLVSPASSDAITVVPTGKTFAGDVLLKFHVWLNANGAFPAGGTGSTQQVSAGVMHNSTTANRSGVSGSGAWVTATGEGGAVRDMRIHLNGVENQTLATYNYGSQDNAAYAALFPGVDVAAVNGGALTAAQGVNQTGTTANGAVGFAWHEMEVQRIGNSVSWKIDGLNIATIDVTGQPDGNVAVGYHDPFTGVSNNPGQLFAIIDNLTVVVPEPASLSLLGLSLVSLLAGRRR